MTKSVAINRPIGFESADIYKIGSYEILLDHQIGVGGYSVVYIGRCVDEHIATKYNIDKSKVFGNDVVQHVVAVKKIIVKGLSYKHQKMVNEEITIMKHIRDNPHPNIVTCYDIVDDLDTIYIIMEYCDSFDLSRTIGKPMKESSVRYYMRQLISGIKYLDDNKIIHRDIKPKNLLLTDGRRVLKICDFGLAKNRTGLSRIYTICGSPLYMAPEMFSERSYNDTVDIWSIGIIMYEMLYGSNPLCKMKDYTELESFMLNDKERIMVPPKNSKNRNKDVSKSCLDLLRTLLNKDSTDRITLKQLYTNEWLIDSDRQDDPHGDNEHISGYPHTHPDHGDHVDHGDNEEHGEHKDHKNKNKMDRKHNSDSFTNSNVMVFDFEPEPEPESR